MTTATKTRSRSRSRKTQTTQVRELLSNFIVYPDGQLWYRVTELHDGQVVGTNYGEKIGYLGGSNRPGFKLPELTAGMELEIEWRTNSGFAVTRQPNGSTTTQAERRFSKGLVHEITESGVVQLRCPIASAREYFWPAYRAVLG